MIKEKFNISPDDNKMLHQLYRRTLCIGAEGSFEKMQALPFLYCMIPVINRFYQKKEDRIAAYRRHFEFFNTTPSIASFITGLTAAMEKKASQDPDFDTKSISAVKTSLMGPFAGIGDAIFWGTLRIITLGIGISLALQGNILGPILHIVLYNIPAHFSRYYGTFIGYGLGSEFLEKTSKSGIMSFITKAASIVGLMTVGAMTCTMVNVSTPLVLNFQGAELALQSIFDQIFPNLLPLGLTFGCFGLMKKGAKPIWLIFALMALGIVGKVVGLF